MKLMDDIQSVTAFAPATCANVAVGFDILGFSIDDVGDTLTLTRREDQRHVIEHIDSNDTLPYDEEKNICTAVLKKICKDLQIDAGFSLRIHKGISLGSGMGGSAASAAATLTAFNAFLSKPLTLNELVPYALYGEAVACGHAHADNIVPCLFGGLTLIRCIDPVDVIQLPVPNCYCTIVHPHLRIDTKVAREILANDLPLKDYVQQSANLASFITALHKNDLNLLQKSLNDVLIEPRRAKLLPRFHNIKKAALNAGALGVSFSGSGPSLFSFANNKNDAENIGIAMCDEFKMENIAADMYITRISNNAARIVNIIKD